MTLDEAIIHAEEVADSKERQVINGDWEKGSMTECNCIECAEEHRQLAEWLKELKQLKEQTRWIPVSERLPEFSKEVLTCSNGGFIEIQSLEDSYDGYWENQSGDWTDFDEVIAWMPLPEPPHLTDKEKEE